MQKAFPPLGILAPLLLVTLIILPSCTTEPEDYKIDISQAARLAAEKAVAEGSINLPSLPAECYISTPHAALIEKNEAVITLKHERNKLDESNSKRNRCVEFYSALAAALKNKGEVK